MNKYVEPEVQVTFMEADCIRTSGEMNVQWNESWTTWFEGGRGDE